MSDLKTYEQVKQLVEELNAREGKPVDIVQLFETALNESNAPKEKQLNFTFDGGTF